jgi:hypothetical protein
MRQSLLPTNTSLEPFETYVSPCHRIPASYPQRTSQTRRTNTISPRSTADDKPETNEAIDRLIEQTDEIARTYLGDLNKAAQIGVECYKEGVY